MSEEPEHAPLADEIAMKAEAEPATTSEEEGTEAVVDDTPDTEEAVDTLDSEEGEPETSAEVNDEPETVKDEATAEPDEKTETKSQRRRRMRREREQTISENLKQAHAENERLRQRLGDLKVPEFKEFDNPDDYTAERAAHAAEARMLQAEADRASGTVQDAQSQASQERSKAIQDTFDDGGAAYSDFESVVTNQSLDISENMLSASLEADNATDVLYFLGKNSDEATRISRLSPIAQAVEVGKLSTRLTSRTNKTTKAPPPIKSLKGTQKPKSGFSDNMSMAAYIALRNKASK